MLKEQKGAQDIRCCFCNNLKGVMRKLKNGAWVHLLCVKWIPEITFRTENEL